MGAHYARHPCAPTPTGPSSGSSRVIRGGAWLGTAGGARSAIRGGNRPTFRNDAIGFRAARAVTP